MAAIGADFPPVPPELATSGTRWLGRAGQARIAAAL